MPVPMPDAGGGEALIETAQALGWCEHRDMGPVPLTAQEIRAWCAGTGERLTHWEFATLREMSEAYVNGSRGKSAPYQPTVISMGLATASFMASQSGAKTSRR